MSYKVEKIEAMKRKEGGQEEALNILKRIAKQVEPIMEKRRWRVGKLAEFFPDNGGLLGLNVNRGQKILIRLRHAHSPSVFMEVEALIDTMLHELVHIEIGPHNDKFYDMLEELRKECDDLVMKGLNAFKDAHIPFDGQGQVLGGQKPMGRAGLRDAMAKAAQRRAQTGKIMDQGGRRLGGSQCSKEELKQRMLRAAEQRRLDSERCRTAQELAAGDVGGRDAWACGLCTFLNKHGDDKCAMCSTRRDKAAAGNGGGAAAGKGGLGSRGPWTCGVCTFANEHSDDSCAACSARRSEAGGDGGVAPPPTQATAPPPPAAAQKRPAEGRAGKCSQSRLLQGEAGGSRGGGAAAKSGSQSGGSGGKGGGREKPGAAAEASSSGSAGGKKRGRSPPRGSSATGVVASPRRSRREEEDMWPCSACTYLNERAADKVTCPPCLLCRPECEVCDTARHHGRSRAAAATVIDLSLTSP